MEDNQGAIAMAQNPVHHAKTKHIDIRYHFARKAIQNTIISLIYCPRTEMAADLLTKLLPKQQFQKLKNIMCL